MGRDDKTQGKGKNLKVPPFKSCGKVSNMLDYSRKEPVEREREKENTEKRMRGRGGRGRGEASLKLNEKYSEERHLRESRPALQEEEVAVQRPCGRK